MTLEQYNGLNKKHLCDGLKHLRKIKGYSLEDVSFYTKKDVGYLSRMENGKTSPKFETVSDILAFYEMTIKDFYDMIDELI